MRSNMSNEQARDVVEERAERVFHSFPHLRHDPAGQAEVYKMVAVDMTLATADLACEKVGFVEWTTKMLGAAWSVAWGTLVGKYEEITGTGMERDRRQAIRRLANELELFFRSGFDLANAGSLGRSRLTPLV